MVWSKVTVHIIRTCSTYMIAGGFRLRYLHAGNQQAEQQTPYKYLKRSRYEVQYSTRRPAILTMFVHSEVGLLVKRFKISHCGTGQI